MAAAGNRIAGVVAKTTASLPRAYGSQTARYTCAQGSPCWSCWWLSS